MLPFCIGVVAGGLIGFLICAIFSINKAEEDYKRPRVTQEEGDTDAPN